MTSVVKATKPARNGQRTARGRVYRERESRLMPELLNDIIPIQKRQFVAFGILRGGPVRVPSGSQDPGWTPVQADLAGNDGTSSSKSGGSGWVSCARSSSWCKWGWRSGGEWWSDGGHRCSRSSDQSESPRHRLTAWAQMHCRREVCAIARGQCESALETILR